MHRKRRNFNIDNEFERLERRVEGLASNQSEANAHIASLAEQVRSALKRIDEQRKLVETVQSIALSVERVTNSLKNTDAKVNKMSGDLEEIKGRAGKRLDSITGAVIAAVFSGLVGFLLARLGM